MVLFVAGDPEGEVDVEVVLPLGGVARGEVGEGEAIDSLRWPRRAAGGMARMQAAKRAQTAGWAGLMRIGSRGRSTVFTNF